MKTFYDILLFDGVLLFIELYGST